MLVAFSHAHAAHARDLAPPRRVWLDVVRVGIGIASLVGALVVAAFVEVSRGVYIGLVAFGIVAFSTMMVLAGRAVTSRWLAFGAELGFQPGARRPLLDFGTDRPVLYGRAGRHPARLRHLLARGPEGRGEWLEVDMDLLSGAPEAEILWLARSGAARVMPSATVRVDRGRLAMRAPFDDDAARALVDALATVADGIVQ